MARETDTAPDFTAWLNRQVERRGWSGSELARRMDILPGTANNWLAGRRRLSDRKLILRMAEVLDVHQDEILEQLDMREGGADHMSLAVRRLQPLIDSIQWNEDAFQLAESMLVGIRRMREGEYEIPEFGSEE